MTIWILALILLASGVGLGLRQGAIRTSFAFMGILVGGFCAALVGHLLKPILRYVGIENHTLVWMIAPIEGFIIVWVLFKVVGFEVHRRVNVYYKYKVSDLQLGLWERLNSRVGGCVGLLNGTAWLVLISFLLFNFSYWTAQIAPSDQESRTTRMINEMGHDLQSTGLDKVGRAVGNVPGEFYRTANFLGLLVQNPALASRLADYPAFLSLSQSSQMQQLTGDGGLAQEWKEGAPMGEIMNNSQVKSLLKDTNFTATVWSIVQTNMDDITNYLFTGKSPKYDSELIVGRWNFDLVPALADLRQAHPKIKSNEMKALRAIWSQAFAETTFLAGSDGQAFLKNVPDFDSQPPTQQSWTGQWTGGPTNYDLSLTANGHSEDAAAQTDGLRLSITLGKTTYVFERTY